MPVSMEIDFKDNNEILVYRGDWLVIESKDEKIEMVIPRNDLKKFTIQDDTGQRYELKKEEG